MKTFFDESDRLERLSELGDRLETLNKAVNFEIFRSKLSEIWISNDKRLGGRQKMDSVLMFKILILQKLYSIADDKTEYLINDRLSFQRFLGLGLGDKVPDSKTIWLYKEELTKSGCYKEVFNLFNELLEKAGVITRKGSIVDATISQRPQQRYNKEKKAREKRGEIEPKERNVHKSRQIDKDATYTVKHGRQFFGYKNHVKVDSDSKIILNTEVTTASASDGKQAKKLINKKDKVLYGDSAYRGQKIAGELIKKNKKIRLEICEKAERGHPLTDEQKANNTVKSKVRCRVEHTFGHMVKSMGGKLIQRVGYTRARCEIYLKNLAYNLSRWAYLSTTWAYSALST